MIDGQRRYAVALNGTRLRYTYSAGNIFPDSVAQPGGWIGSARAYPETLGKFSTAIATDYTRSLAIAKRPMRLLHNIEIRILH